MHPVDMAMDDIEIVHTSGDHLQQTSVCCDRVGSWPSEPKRPWPSRDQFGSRPGIATRKQRHVVSEINEFVDQPRNHAFRSAVQFWRDAFGERCDLGDSHVI
jgi:hypothetical protein